jgi:hypothetical protein
MLMLSLIPYTVLLLLLLPVQRGTLTPWVLSCNTTDDVNG